MFRTQAPWSALPLTSAPTPSLRAGNGPFRSAKTTPPCAAGSEYGFVFPSTFLRLMSTNRSCTRVPRGTACHTNPTSRRGAERGIWPRYRGWHLLLTMPPQNSTPTRPAVATGVLESVREAEGALLLNDPDGTLCVAAAGGGMNSCGVKFASEKRSSPGEAIASNDVIGAVFSCPIPPTPESATF